MDALRGIGLVMKTPRLWLLCVGPGLGAIALYALIGWLLWHFVAAPRLGDSAWSELALVILWLITLPIAFYLFTSAFLGIIYDPLSRAVEGIARDGIANDVPAAPLGAGTLFLDSLARFALNALVGLAAFALSFVPVVGVFAGLLGAALIGALDYTAPACLRRGLTLGPQRRALLGRIDRDTLVFALLAGALSTIPFVGLLFAPGLVAGGTLLARRRLGAGDVNR